MAKRKAFELPKDDFASEEDCEIYGFTSEPTVTGECISSFSFNDDSINENDINLTSDNKAAGNVDTTSKTTSNIMNFDVSSNDKQNISPKSINYITTQDTISSSNTSNTINNTNLSTNKNNILEDT